MTQLVRVLELPEGPTPNVMPPRRRPTSPSRPLSTFGVGGRTWNAPQGAEVFRAPATSTASVRYVRLPGGGWRVYTSMCHYTPSPENAAKLDEFLIKGHLVPG